MAENSVEQRLRRIEDVEAIRRLKAEYCAACDADNDADAVVALFVGDSPEDSPANSPQVPIWEATGSGAKRGRAEIHRYFADLRASGRMRNSAHNVTNAIVDVDGDRAIGRWRVIMLYTANLPDGDVVFMRLIGWYRDTFRRVDGRWLFESLYCEVEEHAPYAVPGAS
ncbi:MAG: nuclear transport factor 2 family protein [Pseudomonadales bacterium]